MSICTPSQVAANYVAVGKNKTEQAFGRTVILAVLAGMFIALAAVGSVIATATVTSPSIVRLIAGGLFPVGLVMVIIAGSELFTGNSLLVIPCLQKEITVRNMLRNWALVYCGNFIGSLLIVLIVDLSGHWGMLSGAVAVNTIKVAATKSSYGFVQAMCLGIGCNFLVCIAVWISNAADTVSGKVIGLYLPILLFILAGFEHCVANMYYIPAGLIASTHADFAALATAAGVNFSGLSVSSFLLRNLLPVTIGNMIGGSILVGAFYWYAYLFDKSVKCKRYWWQQEELIRN